MYITDIKNTKYCSCITNVYMFPFVVKDKNKFFLKQTYAKIKLPLQDDFHKNNNKSKRRIT